MTIDGNHITADAGKAIRRKGDTTEATATEAWLAPNDSADNFEEVDYGYLDEIATEADKDAALETLGVDMTEG